MVLRHDSRTSNRVGQAQPQKAAGVRKRHTTHRYFLTTPMHIDKAPNCRILAVRIVNDSPYTAVCRVVDGEIEGWPFLRAPTHCIALPEGK